MYVRSVRHVSIGKPDHQPSEPLQNTVMALECWSLLGVGLVLEVCDFDPSNHGRMMSQMHSGSAIGLGVSLQRQQDLISSAQGLKRSTQAGRFKMR